MTLIGRLQGFSWKNRILLGLSRLRSQSIVPPEVSTANDACRNSERCSLHEQLYTLVVCDKSVSSRVCSVCKKAFDSYEDPNDYVTSIKLSLALGETRVKMRHKYDIPDLEIIVSFFCCYGTRSIRWILSS